MAKTATNLAEAIDVGCASSRKAAVERAVRSLALALLDRKLSPTQVLAVLTALMAGELPPDLTPRECAAATDKSRRQRMLDELFHLEHRGREAVMVVARKFVGDPLDPVEVHSLARKLRRWRAAENRTMSVCPPTKQVRTTE